MTGVCVGLNLFNLGKHSAGHPVFYKMSTNPRSPSSNLSRRQIFPRLCYQGSDCQGPASQHPLQPISTTDFTRCGSTWRWPREARLNYQTLASKLLLLNLAATGCPSFPLQSGLAHTLLVRLRVMFLPQTEEFQPKKKKIKVLNSLVHLLSISHQKVWIRNRKTNSWMQAAEMRLDS